MYSKDKNCLGKIVNQFHTNRLCKLMADHKGTVIIGNPQAHEDGNLLPTVILNPAEDCSLMAEETFGPILSIFTYKKIEEVIKTINSKPKPLSVYYFGTNSNRNENLNRLIKETSSGAFLVNEVAMQMFHQDLPFGGVGESGYGRLHGKEGFNSCSNKKSVLRKVPLKFYPFSVIFAPYTEDKQRVITLLATKLDFTQGQLKKKAIILLIVLFLLWLIATKRLTIQKVKKFWMMLKMMFAMMRK